MPCGRRDLAHLCVALRRRAGQNRAMLRALALVLSICVALPAAGQDSGLRAALPMVAARDWDRAIAAVQTMGPVAADIVEWHRLRSGVGSSGDYESFLDRRADWPGLDLLRRRGEVAVARSVMPDRILAWFGDRMPTTVQGGRALIGALRASGQADAAAQMAARVWVDLTFDAEEQAEFLAAEGPGLAAHHIARLDRLLWADRGAEARRMYPLVPEGWQKLAEARLTLLANGANVDARIAAVPGDLAEHPGLAHARFDWRARKGLTEGALDLLQGRSQAGTLGNPDLWAGRRAGIARSLLRAGQAKQAQEVASGHHLTSGGAFADLEFLAGYISLRHLADPETALTHFHRLEEGVSTPISLTRAAYWIGRAEDAAGRPEAAQAAYARAAVHQTAYYGLLAAERLGQTLDPALLGQEPAADWRKGAFLGSSVMEAALLLYGAGDAALARRFVLHLAEGLDADALRALGELALALSDDNLAVLIGKQAAARGIILPRAYFPDTSLLPATLAVPRSLALAIARRESEFNPAATSPAGALGLMQVMPGTAKMMADKLGVAYQVARLTSDAGYNAGMGAAYLDVLQQEFGTSLALVAAGYNAGPGRPRAWIADYGDPRLPGVDVVDWV
ncbi:MAG: lytic transglycosylase domain-containing protein, partial [Gemmobacter sp.]|nr:lytic transglycosylase domain-containing protein [Gemmobacter sp.]